MGSMCPPSNFWISFILMWIIGSESWEKDLKTAFHYSSVCFQKSEVSTEELLWEIENNHNSWLLCFKAPWRLMFNTLIKIQLECQQCHLCILWWHHLLMFLVNKNARRFMYLESSFKAQLKLVHPHDTVLGVAVVVFTRTFPYFSKRGSNLTHWYSCVFALKFSILSSLLCQSLIFATVS